MKRGVVDAVILGGGAAGLAAARDLSQAGKTAILVEARQRLGGRIYTVHDHNAPLPLELGAEFVHGEAVDTFAVIRAEGLLVPELSDQHYWSRAGKLYTVPDFWRKVDRIRRDIRRKLSRSKADRSMHEYLDRARIPSPLRQMMVNFVENYHAAHIDKISAKSLASGDEETEVDGAAGNRQFRIVDGGDALIRWLRGGLDPERIGLRLNHVAAELRWKRGEATLQCRSATGADLRPIRARAAIVTLPLGVLKGGPDTPGGLRFMPEIPEKKRALDRLEFGHVFKMVLRFRQAFWAEEDFVRKRLQTKREKPRELNFVHARDAAIATWWTALPAQAPILTAWAGGPGAEELLNESEMTRLERTLEALGRTFGIPRRIAEELLEAWALHDWRADPYSRGAYTYVGVGGTTAQKTLATPVASTLFFAGEATTADETGTVAGAIASGRRAAREVLRGL